MVSDQISLVNINYLTCMHTFQSYLTSIIEAYGGQSNQQAKSEAANKMQNVFLRSYSCFSPAFIGRPDINRGNKSKSIIQAFVNVIYHTKSRLTFSMLLSLVILPSSALHELARLKIQYPMTFRISNQQLGTSSCCGVLEFSAEEGQCFIPYWMMQNLGLDEGSEVILRNLSLKKGTLVRMRPHETAFIELPCPLAVLEQELTFYSTLKKGDTINIQFEGRDYAIDVLDCQPEPQIICLETNLAIEFDPPKDQSCQEESKDLSNQVSQLKKATIAEEEKEKESNQS